jgi:hypothetical protein
MRPRFARVPTPGTPPGPQRGDSHPPPPCAGAVGARPLRQLARISTFPAMIHHFLFSIMTSYHLLLIYHIKARVGVKEKTRKSFRAHGSGTQGRQNPGQMEPPMDADEPSPASASPSAGTKMSSRQARQEREEEQGEYGFGPWRSLRLCESYNSLLRNRLWICAAIVWKNIPVVSS